MKRSGLYTKRAFSGPNPSDGRLGSRGGLIRVTVRLSDGPGRDRTCDLGIKTPAGVAASSCDQWKMAAKSTFANCDEQQQIAGCGDQSVLPSVLPFGATAWPQALVVRATDARTAPPTASRTSVHALTCHPLGKELRLVAIRREYSRCRPKCHREREQVVGSESLATEALSSHRCEKVPARP